MKIIDWRPRGEKFLLTLWRSKSDQLQSNWGHDLWATFHNSLINKRINQRQDLLDSPLIVSVGNLSLGGTGKTPVVIKLAQDLAARNRKGIVLTRGYKSPLAGPLRVTADNQRAGDEARLLAAAIGSLGWSVVQARSRQAGLAWILNNGEIPDVIILEDGHQTAGIARHIDILILDHWSITRGPESDQLVPATGPVFPWGPWRESVSGADRAEFWLCESEDSLPQPESDEHSVYTFGRSFSLAGANRWAEGSIEPERPMLVSGIARPEKFESGAQALLPSPATLAVRLADHTPYDAALVKRLESVLKESGCCSLVTTAKDWIKLAPMWPADVAAYTIGLAIVWGQNEALVDHIDKRL